MAFSAATFDPNAFAIATPQTQVYTSDPSYWVPLKVRVEIYNNIGTELLLVYDSFLPETNDIVLLECDVTLGLTNSGFLLKFEDGAGVIDQNKIGLGNKVLIYAGRSSDNLTLLFTGYSETRSPIILGNNVMDYVMTGYNEMASFNDIIVNFKRASSELVDIDDPNFPKRPDSKMAVFELVTDLMEDIDVRVTRDIRIKEYLNLDISGISPSVTERLLSIVQSMTELSQVMNFLSEVTGAYWKVENGRLIFEYPDIQHSGIIIKNKKTSTDLVSSTSYFAGPWQYTDSISKSDGFANRIYTSTTMDTKSVANSMTNRGSTTLYNRAIAQQFQTLDSRISSIALLLSRIGTPFTDMTGVEGGVSTEIAEQVINGEIRIDNENKPTGPVIAEFKAEVGGLSSTADTIFVNEIKVDASVLSPNAKYWIVLMPTGTSNRDAIRWHHNGDLSTINQYSAFAKGEDKTDLSDFKVARFGPTYGFAVFAKIRRLQEYSDPQSINRFRLKEDVVSIDFLDDSTSVNKMMQNVIAVRGKPVRKYQVNEVTLPNGLWFTPGMNVTINDDTGHHEEDRNIFAEIHEVKYSWSTSAADQTIGIFKVNVLPVGVLNWHSELFPSGD
jgi:hypothetical protein